MAVSTEWQQAKAVIGDTRVTLGPQASRQWLDAPDHLAMVLARYRAAAALIGDAQHVTEMGCGEGIGAGILAKGRRSYLGFDLDDDALAVARCLYPDPTFLFLKVDLLRHLFVPQGSAAVVSLDVIEHLPADREDDFMRATASHLTDHGVCVIGTPNAVFDPLASPQSKAGHINTYTHNRLHELMSRYFAVVQSFGLQDTSLHLGHPSARHYLLMTGIGVRR